MSNEIKVKTIKCEKGVYFNMKKQHYSGMNVVSYRYNKTDKAPVPTWNKDWHLLEGEDTITSIELRKTGERVNWRWELCDKEDNTLNLPETISLEDSDEYYDDDDYYHYIGNKCDHHKYRFLYHRVSDKGEDYWVEEEIVVEDEGSVSVEEVDNFTDMKILVSKRRDSYTNWETKDIHQDLISITNFSELDKMLVPPLAIHNRPCSINADTTYKIIRNHIKDNINSKYARVTSDYDFCFTVKKKIRITPYVNKVERKKGNGKSYAKPRFDRYNVDNKEISIFEMCPSKPYQKYTPILGFRGETLADLAENIKLYLDELMDVINAPLHECEKCNGTGHILQEEFDKNKR